GPNGSTTFFGQAPCQETFFGQAAQQTFFGQAAFISNKQHLLPLFPRFSKPLNDLRTGSTCNNAEAGIFAYRLCIQARTIAWRTGAVSGSAGRYDLRVNEYTA